MASNLHRACVQTLKLKLLLQRRVSEILFVQKFKILNFVMKIVFVLNWMICRSACNPNDKSYGSENLKKASLGNVRTLSGQIFRNSYRNPRYWSKSWIKCSLHVNIFFTKSSLLGSKMNVILSIISNITFPCKKDKIVRKLQLESEGSIT